MNVKFPTFKNSNNASAFHRRPVMGDLQMLDVDHELMSVQMAGYHGGHHNDPMFGGKPSPAPHPAEDSPRSAAPSPLTSAVNNQHSTPVDATMPTLR